MASRRKINTDSDKANLQRIDLPIEPEDTTELDTDPAPPVSPPKVGKHDEQVTKNFNLKELEFYDAIPDELLDNARMLLKEMQKLRDFLGNHKITIISGYRSPDRNKAVSGASNSQHLYARACDFKVEGMKVELVADRLRELIYRGGIADGGLGVYPDFIHYDIRTKFGMPKARWKG
jgi:hypothetical protein